eukprot:12093571-Prorocentrum_lima.AAC.1
MQASGAAVSTSSTASDSTGVAPFSASSASSEVLAIQSEVKAEYEWQFCPHSVVANKSELAENYT